MTDSIDAVISALAERGKGGQVEWADGQTRWDEGTIVVRRDAGRVVLTQLGRVQAEDRVEEFASEDEAAAALRRRLLDPTVRELGPGEADDVRERMQRRAEQIKAELRVERGDA